MKSVRLLLNVYNIAKLVNIKSLAKLLKMASLDFNVISVNFSSSNF